MKSNQRGILLLFLLLPAFLFSLSAGSSGMPLMQLIQGTLHHQAAESAILLHIRLPRSLGALIAGLCLGTAGALLQTVLRSPLAAPSIIGVNSGAGFAAALAVSVFSCNGATVSGAAFVGALAAVLLVWGLSRTFGGTSLILSGVAISSLLTAGTDTIITLIPDAAISRSAFTLGGFSGITLAAVSTAFFPVLAGMTGVFLLRREARLLSLGDDCALGLGVKVSRVRFGLLLCASLLCACAVYLAGLLGFVGLMAPHLAALLLPHGMKGRMAAAGLTGALLCLVCDGLARLLFAPYELPVGILLSCLGVPFFLFLLYSRRKEMH